jgi:translation elongation factor EF-1alpha
MIPFVMSGHVDHGKSTICGRILYESNYIEPHEFEKIKNEAIKNGHTGSEFAYLLDICQDEREKAITNDYNRVEFSFDQTDFALIDTPGHKQFIRSLITGLNASNPCRMVGCIVISALENEFNSGFGKGQTKEDMLLMRAVGINHVLVLVNKMDKYDYDEDVYNSRCVQIKKYISKMGFKTVQYILISGYTGHNIKRLLSEIKRIHSQIKPEKYKQKQTIDSVLLHVRVKMLNLNTIMCAGFVCMLHVHTHEYEIVVESVHSENDPNRPFAKNGDTVQLQLKRIDKHPFVVQTMDRVIIRQNDATIGFGVVTNGQ